MFAAWSSMLIARTGPAMLENVGRKVVLGAAWWYEEIVLSARVAADHATVVCLRRLVGISVACRIANWAESTAGYLAGEWPSWQIARRHLQAKWNLELEEANRKFRAEQRAAALQGIHRDGRGGFGGSG